MTHPSLQENTLHCVHVLSAMSTLYMYNVQIRLVRMSTILYHAHNQLTTGISWYIYIHISSLSLAGLRRPLTFQFRSCAAGRRGAGGGVQADQPGRSCLSSSLLVDVQLSRSGRYCSRHTCLSFLLGLYSSSVTFLRLVRSDASPLTLY